MRAARTTGTADHVVAELTGGDAGDVQLESKTPYRCGAGSSGGGVHVAVLEEESVPAMPTESRILWTSSLVAVGFPNGEVSKQIRLP